MRLLGAWRRKGRLRRMSCSMGALQVGPECCRDRSRFSMGLQDRDGKDKGLRVPI